MSEALNAPVVTTTPATLAAVRVALNPGPTVVKNGMLVTSGIVATNPFAPFAVRASITLLFLSVKVAVGVRKLAAPPAVAKPSTSLLPSQLVKKVGLEAATRAKYVWLFPSGVIRSKYELNVVAFDGDVCVLPNPAVSISESRMPGTPKLFTGSVNFVYSGRAAVAPARKAKLEVTLAVTGAPLTMPVKRK